MRFDEHHRPDSITIDTILNAARRAPSAGNSQPWRFIVGQREDSVHQRLTKHLARSSSAWAPGASFLVANLAQVRVEGSDLEYSEFAHYDLGQATAHMTFQAHALGLFAHQFRAFDRDAMAREFSVPAHFEVVSMTAFGVAAHTIDEVVGSGTSRDRFDLDEIVLARAT
jgi:nitroreductase